MLTVDLKTLQHIEGSQRADSAIKLTHLRRIRNNPPDPIDMRRGFMPLDENGDRGRLFQHVANEVVVTASRFFAGGGHSESVANALYDCGLAGAAAADQHVQVRVEPQFHSIEESALPARSQNLLMRHVGFLIESSHPCRRIDECLAQPL